MRRRLSPAREIGLNVAYLRRRCGISQQVLANKAGLTRDQLANIESFRVALKLQAGWRICQALDVHPSMLLSLATPLPFPPDDAPNRSLIESLVNGNPSSTFWKGWPPIAWLLGADGLRFAESQKLKLTEAANTDTIGTVTTELGALRMRVQRLLQAKGDVSRLAQYLQAPLSSVSRWLSGDREPGGETALKLLKWVEEEERKNQ